MLRQNVNINSYPTKLEPLPAQKTIALGDLHGNTLRLLHQLVRESAVAMQKDDYDKFSDIYSNRPLTTSRRDIDAVLNKITLNKVIILLLGDEVCDRGASDLLSLLLFDRLGDQIEFLASNHWLEFFKQHIFLGINNASIHPEFRFIGDITEFGGSFYGLRTAIANGCIQENEVNDLINRYFNKIKLLSYNITSDGIEIFSHAPVTPETIQFMATILYVKYYDDSPQELAETIDQLNIAFRKRIKNKDNLSEFVRVNNALDRFLWGRYQNIYVFAFNNFKVVNIHGHVGEGVNCYAKLGLWSYLNIDTNLAKSPKTPEGKYYSHLSNAPSLRDILLQEQERQTAAQKETTADPKNERRKSIAGYLGKSITASALQSEE
jgi:hypothetical protein